MKETTLTGFQTLSGLIKQDASDTVPVSRQAGANIYKKSGILPCKIHTLCISHFVQISHSFSQNKYHLIPPILSLIHIPQ